MLQTPPSSAPRPPIPLAPSSPPTTPEEIRAAVSQAIAQSQLNEPVIASITLCGPNRQRPIIQAIRSVAWVDVHVLIDTGQPGSKQTVESAVEAARQNGVDYAITTIEWESFGQARTAALQFARQVCSERFSDQRIPLGVIVDTDEILLFGPKPRSALHQLCQRGLTNVSTHDDRGYYSKDRVFDLRKENRARFVGYAHEYTAKALPGAVVADFAFHEEPKSAAQNRQKFERDEVLLLSQITDAVGSALLDLEAVKAAVNRCDKQLSRWYFYLGTTKQALGRDDWREFLQMSADIDEAFPEQAAWCSWLIAKERYARYDAAELKDNAERLAIAAIAAKSFGQYPMAETAWLIGKLHHDRKEYLLSLAWARAASSFVFAPRLNFRELDASRWIYDLLLWNPHCTQTERAAAEQALTEMGHAEMVEVARKNAPKIEVQPPISTG